MKLCCWRGGGGVCKSFGEVLASRCGRYSGRCWVVRWAMGGHASRQWVEVW